jgi:hypothetical protein
VTVQELYECARRHGLSHEKAVDAVAEGKLRCWCGSPTPCIGGAQRFVGCAYIDTPTYKGWAGEAA